MPCSDDTGITESPKLMERDRLANLLAFQPRQSRQQFLSDSLRRFEEGHHFYSRVENGVLLHYGGLIDRQTKNFFMEVGQEFSFPPGTAVLYNLYTDPLARGLGYYQAALRQMIQDAVADPETRHIYISVL